MVAKNNIKFKINYVMDEDKQKEQIAKCRYLHDIIADLLIEQYLKKNANTIKKK